MRGTEWALTVGLVIVGLYFLIFHMDPFPANHEAIFPSGLDKMHLVHDVIGVVLIGLAGLIVWRTRRAHPAKPAM